MDIVAKEVPQQPDVQVSITLTHLEAVALAIQCGGPLYPGNTRGRFDQQLAKALNHLLCPDQGANSCGGFSPRPVVKPYENKC